MENTALDIIFTSPHPDDLEIGMGGTIGCMVEQGYRVGMVHLTNGEPTPRGSVETRLKEMRAAADVLGVRVVEMLGLTNRELMDGPPTRYALATVLRKYRPGILVGMAGRTPAASPDHYQGQLITEAARFYSQLTRWDDRFDSTPPHRLDHLIYRPVPLAAERHQFASQFVVDITTTIDRKIEAIRCYASQFDDVRFERLKHYVLSIAGAEGGLSGFKYGELYAVPRPIGVKDLAQTLGQWEIPPPFTSPPAI